MKINTVVVFVLLIPFILSCTQKNKQSQTESESLSAGDIMKDSPCNIEMVYIPEGKFIMGSDTGGDDEKPAHEVSLDSYYIGQNLISQKEWSAVMDSNRSEVKGDSLPVTNVSWDEAQEFASKISEKTGFKYRLPTEAEWEYACRAGSTTKFYFGNDTLKLGDYAWYKDNSGREIQPVGQKIPNDWGLYDMSGNVWEWCFDWWDPGYYARSPSKNPVNEEKYLYKIPSTGEGIYARVARSGCFVNTPRGLESAHRHGGKQEDGYYYIGFRLVREI